MGRRLLLTCLVGALYLACRCPGLGQSLWLDEILSMDFAQGTVPEILEHTAREDMNPPLFYVALRYWQKLGRSDEVLQSLPLLLGLVWFVLLVLVGREVAGFRGAWFTAVLAATCWATCWPSYELRAFTMQNAWLTAAWLFLLRALRREKAGDWIGVAVASAGALWTHYYSALLLPALIVWTVKRTGGWRTSAALVACGVAAGLAFVPWYSAFETQIHRINRLHYTSLATPADVIRSAAVHVTRCGPWTGLSELFRMLGAQFLGQIAILTALASGALAYAFRWTPFDAVGKKGSAVAFRCASMLALMLVLILTSGVVGTEPNLRYASFLGGVFCVLAGSVLASARPRAGIFVLALLAGTSAPVSFLGATESSGGWRGASAAMQSRVADGELLLFQYPWEGVAFSYYTEPARPPWTDLTAARNVERVTIRVNAALAARQSLWLGMWTGGGLDSAAPQTRTFIARLRALNYHLVDVVRTRAVLFWHFSHLLPDETRGERGARDR